MVYLDYAANTPVDEEVMRCFIDENNRYIANPNSGHRMGLEAKERLDEITVQIAKFLGVKTTEIIYTSGASEANNLAIKGIVESYRHNGKCRLCFCNNHATAGRLGGDVQRRRGRGRERTQRGVRRRSPDL